MAAALGREEAALRAAESTPRTPHETARAADILRQVRVHLSAQTREATLELSPRSLGRIEVKLTLEGGRMRAHLRVERAETLAALERHVPELRAALGAQDIETESFELSLGFGETASQSGEPDAQQPGPSDRRGSNWRTNDPLGTPEEQPLRAELAAALADGSRVDTYV